MRNKGAVATAALFLAGIAIVGGFLYTKYDRSKLSLGAPSATYQHDIFPRTDSTYELGTSTLAWLRINSDEVCLTGDSCRTTWPTGVGSISFGDLIDTATSSDATGDVYYLNSSGQIVNLGVGSAGQVLKVSGGLPSWGTDATSAGGTTGTVSTSSVPTQGHIPYWTTSGATPELLGSIATTSVSCSGTASCTSFTAIGSGPITITGSGGSGSGNVATSTTESSGYLAYWTSDGATPATLGEVATSSITYNAPITTAGTAGYIVGGSGFTLDVDDIQPADLANADFGEFSCNGTNCSVDADVIDYSNIDNTATLAGNLVLGASDAFFGDLGILFEGATDDTLEGLLTSANITGADKTWTLPNTTGNIALLTSAMTGTFDGNNFGGGAIGQGDLLYGSAAGTISELAKDTNATRYLSNQGTSNNPSWNQVNLANGVTGTLPEANGGTGDTDLDDILGTANQITVTDGANTIIAGNATLSLPSHVIFPSSFFASLASTTNATTTNFHITSLGGGGGDLKVDSNGRIYEGTDSTGSGAFSWTPGTTYNENANSTSTPIWLKDTLYASSTAFFHDAVTFNSTIVNNEGALTDDTVLEADLKAVDAAGDEECLTYEATGGDFEWQTCSASTEWTDGGDFVYPNEFVDEILIGTSTQHAKNILTVTATSTNSIYPLNVLNSNDDSLFNVGLATSTFTTAIIGKSFYNAGNAITGGYALAIGETNNISGYASGAVGYGNTISGTESFAVGDLNTITGDYNFAAGDSNSVSGPSSAAFGKSNTITGTNEGVLVNGISNTVTSGTFVFVNGNSNSITDTTDISVFGNTNIANDGNSDSVMGGNNNVLYAGATDNVLWGDSNGSYTDSNVAIGNNNIFSNGSNASVIIGGFASTSAATTVTVGTGVNSANPLTNSVAGAVMLGSNSTIPAITISNAGGAGLLSNVGVGTSSPGFLLQVNGIASKKGFLALSDSGAGTDIKHWTLSSQGGNLYVATSTDAYATSSVPAITIDTTGQITFGNAQDTCVALTGSAGLCDGDDTGGSGTFAWTPDTTYGENANSTSTPIWLKDTLYASSTAFFHDQVTIISTASTTIPTPYITGILYDSAGTGGASGQVLQSTGTGVQWATASGGGGFTSTGGINSLTNAGDLTGVGTSTPWAKLSVHNETGETNPLFVIATSSASATTTVLEINHTGNLTYAQGALTYDYPSNTTAIENLELTAQEFDTDAGAVSWIDMPVVSAAADTVESYTAFLGGEPAITVYGTSTGSGIEPTSVRVGIGTTTPTMGFKLSVNGLILSDGTVDYSEVYEGADAKQLLANIRGTGTSRANNFKELDHATLPDWMKMEVTENQRVQTGTEVVDVWDLDTQATTTIERPVYEIQPVTRTYRRTTGDQSLQSLLLKGTQDLIVDVADHESRITAIETARALGSTGGSAGAGAAGAAVTYGALELAKRYVEKKKSKNK